VRDMVRKSKHSGGGTDKPSEVDFCLSLDRRTVVGREVMAGLGWLATVAETLSDSSDGTD
jgi:hypothetical protein